MPKFRCYGLVDATVTIGVVEADTPEKATAEDMETAEVPGLCHQCADELQLGDIVKVLVSEIEEDEG